MIPSTPIEFIAVLIKALLVGVILGGMAHRIKKRSFYGWAAIGVAAGAIFPGLSLLALAVLAWLPKRDSNHERK